MRVCSPESSPKAKIMPFSTDNEYGSYRKMIVSIIGYFVAFSCQGSITVLCLEKVSHIWK